jgi:Rod binding domain-containing protein
MDDMISAIDPLSAIGSNINLNTIRSKKDVESEFVSLFISQLMGNVFKAKTSALGGESALGSFSDDLYNEIMMSKISKELAENKAFGFDGLMAADKKW